MKSLPHVCAPAKPASRQPLPHAAGSCSCRLTINGRRYALRPVAIDPSIGSAAFALSKADGSTYHLHLSVFNVVLCDCPDAELRRGDGSRCKHEGALRSLGFFGPPARSERAAAPARDARRLGLISPTLAQSIADTSLVGH